ncbi:MULTISPECIES: RCC1 domain-containing protein [Methylosinus]|nr:MULTISPECIES: RCC1 domain-containing protein [Methylosinus]
MSAFRFVAAAILSLALAAPAFAESASRTRLLSRPNPTKLGQTVKLVGEVDGLGGAPTGTVGFADGAITLGAGPLSPYGAGQATLSMGGQHSCALPAAGGVSCWGRNDYGQLGDGTMVRRSSPVSVSGLPSDIVAISMGDGHSCALTSAGAVECWGWNQVGQLGDGTYPNRSAPGVVTRLSSGVVAIASGDVHSCALTSVGAVKCWGSNVAGQLGAGTPTYHRTPIGVTGLRSGVVAIAGGNQHSCALATAGAVKCWGSNSHGQLGDGTTANRATPVAVPSLSSGVVAITAGWGHSCALTKAGAVVCWGDNSNGQIGDGTTTTRHTPVVVSGLTSGVVAIATGSNHNCALKGNGAVLCWGSNQDGVLGDRTMTNRTTPVAVPGHTRGVVAIALGSDHTCVTISSGVVRCWGSDGLGQLGDGTFQRRRLAPKPIPGFTALVRARGHLLTNSLAVGTHAVQASYPGDAAHTPSSGTQSLTVVP